MPVLPAMPRLEGTPPEDDIYDIVVLAPKESLLPVILWALLALVLLLLAGVALWWLLRRRSRAPELSPRGRAIRRLHQFERREAALAPNAFAHGLSETIKDFLVESYGDPLRYETTEEFLRRSSTEDGATVPEAARRELVDFLLLADEVKFGASPDAARHGTGLLRKANSVIELCGQFGAVGHDGPSSDGKRGEKGELF